MLISFFSSTSFSQTTIGFDFTILKGTEVTILNHLNILYTGTLVNDGELNLKSNITNNGTVSHSDTETSGKISFVGEDQEISGANRLILYDVLFENNSIELKGSIQINNEADFTRGIVNNREHGGSIVFNEFSSHLSKANDSNRSSYLDSYIDGEVHKLGNANFIYPTGNANFDRPIAIKELFSSNNLFSGTYFFENSNKKYLHALKDGIIEFIDSKEYWKISKIEGDDDSAVIELSRDIETSSPEILAADLSNLVIVTWNADKNFWENLGGIVNIENDAINAVVEFTGSGVFALAIKTKGIEGAEDVVVYNYLTPDDNGINDVLIIYNIKKYSDNEVKIYNRWGTEVWKTKGYDNLENAFSGRSNTGLSFNSSDDLPAGTYYYVLNYKVNGKKQQIIDYLYINGK